MADTVNILSIIYGINLKHIPVLGSVKRLEKTVNDTIEIELNVMMKSYS